MPMEVNYIFANMVTQALNLNEFNLDQQVDSNIDTPLKISEKVKWHAHDMDILSTV